MTDTFFAPRKAVTILDPAITTRNAGDEIIADAARRWIRTALPEHFITTLPTHESMGIRSHRLIKQAEYSIVGGSNILTSNLFTDRGWRVGIKDLIMVNKGLILLAAGWRDYQDTPSFTTKQMLRRLLHPTAIHSVRDTHTKEMLSKVGIDNVEVTSCVTMWGLTPEHLKSIDKTKGDTVVTTLNMRQPSSADENLIATLSKIYKRVYIWPQGFDDLQYVSKFESESVMLLAPTLEAYDELLTSDISLDYVGNRLHGGIRALQKKRRAYIVSIDNRAAEISKDTNLPIFARDADSSFIEHTLRKEYDIDLSLPTTNITKWLNQFKSDSKAN